MSNREWLGVASIWSMCAIVAVIVSMQSAPSDPPNVNWNSQTEQACAEQKKRDAYFQFLLKGNAENSFSDQYRAADGDESAEQYPDYCDLAAQESMANSTLWMNIAAWAGVFLTFGGFVLLYLNLRATNESLAEARAAVRAANDANSLSLNMFEFTKRIGIAENRAYIAVEPAGIVQLIRSNDAIGHVIVRNVGNVPARNVQVVVRMEMSEGRELLASSFRQHFGMPLPAFDSDRVMQPGSGMRQGSQQRIPVSKLCTPRHGIYVFGSVTYLNGFGKKCFTRFCHRYSTDSRDRKTNFSVSSGESRVVISAEKARYHTSGNSTEDEDFQYGNIS